MSEPFTTLEIREGKNEKLKLEIHIDGLKLLDIKASEPVNVIKEKIIYLFSSRPELFIKSLQDDEVVVDIGNLSVLVNLQRLIRNKNILFEVERKRVKDLSKKISLARFVKFDEYFFGFSFGDASAGFIRNAWKKIEDRVEIIPSYEDMIKISTFSVKDASILNYILEFYFSNFNTNGSNDFKNHISLLLRFDHKREYNRFFSLLSRNDMDAIEKEFKFRVEELFNLIKSKNIELIIGVSKSKLHERHGCGITLQIDDPLFALFTLLSKVPDVIICAFNLLKNEISKENFLKRLVPAYFDADGWIDYHKKSKPMFCFRVGLYSFDVNRNKEKYFPDWKIGYILNEFSQIFGVKLQVLVRSDNLATGFSVSEILRSLGCKIRTFEEIEDNFEKIIDHLKKYICEVKNLRDFLDTNYPGWREECDKIKKLLVGSCRSVKISNAGEIFEKNRVIVKKSAILSKVWERFEKESLDKKYFLLKLILCNKLRHHGRVNESGVMVGGYNTGGLGIHYIIPSTPQMIKCFKENCRHKSKVQTLSTINYS